MDPMDEGRLRFVPGQFRQVTEGNSTAGGADGTFCYFLWKQSVSEEIDARVG